jgi:subfamily B ATP-binding cassette protein MsbA
MRNARSRLAALLHPGDDDDRLVAEAPELRMREVLRRFWPDARPFRRWMPLGLLLIAIGAGVATAEIWIFQHVVDSVLIPGDLGLLPAIGAAYLGLLLLGAVAAFGDDYLSTWLAERFLLRMRTRVFSHVQRLSLDVLDRHRLGDLISRITSDVQEIEGLLLSGINDGLAAILRIVFFTGALFVLDWQLALIALVVGPLFWYVAKRFSGLVKRASREQRRRSGSLSSVAEESFANAALIQATNGQEVAVERFRTQNEGMIQAELAATRIRGLFSPIVDLIELAGVMMVLGFGTLAVTSGELTVGGLLVFVAYLSQLYGPVRELSSLSNYFFRALAGAERVIEVLDERPRVTDRPGAVELERVHGALELDGVSFTYPGADEAALNEVSLRAAPGETVALVGPSGAGKSTMAKLLLRFYDPDAGSIRLDGRDLRDVTLGSLREQTSMLLQEALILHATARENIALGRPGASKQEIEAAAHAAGAHEFIAALPEGYDTDLGERGRRLSGGQRQRVAIARALLADSPILVLDEPSTGLDARARNALAAPLRELMRDRTSLVISHDLLTTRDADLIVVFDGGRIAEQGRHAELLAHGGLYARLWELSQGSDAGEPAALGSAR